MEEIECRYFWEELKKTPRTELIQQIFQDAMDSRIEEFIWGYGKNYSVTVHEHS